MFFLSVFKTDSYLVTMINILLKSVKSLARQDKRYAMTDGSRAILGNVKHPDTVIRYTLDLTLLL